MLGGVVKEIKKKKQSLRCFILMKVSVISVVLATYVVPTGVLPSPFIAANTIKSLS